MKNDPTLTSSGVDAVIQTYLKSIPKIVEALKRLIEVIRFRLIKPKDRSDYKNALTPEIMEYFKKLAWIKQFPDIW